MNRRILCLLLVLPSLSHAVVCKTVDADGVATFTNLPTAECPDGAALPDYSVPGSPVERVRRVDSPVGTRPADEFAGYAAMRITQPEDGGVVRNNAGQVSVEVEFDPDLLAGHFVTVYLDGKAYRGRYGSRTVDLAGVEPGEHELSAQVTDARGRTLQRSPEITFTYLRALPLQVREVTSKQVKGVFLGGPAAIDSPVTIRFPNSNKEYKGKIGADGTWTVDVGNELATANRFDISVRTGATEFKRSQTLNPAIRRDGAPQNAPGFGPAAPADYSSRGGAISTTPGQTNPAFAPNYTP